MNEAMDLIDQAAAGSRAAQVGLAEQAMQFATSSVGREVEALSAAETWARLAAARGGIGENRVLAGILLARMHSAVAQADLQASAWFEGDARRVLQLLIAMGDPEARRWLEELGISEGKDHDAPNMVFQAHLIAAAGGDADAAGRLFDETLRLLHAGQYDEVEALTVGEVYARLGAATGDVKNVRRLVGVLLRRSEFEYTHGWCALGHNAEAEAATLMSILVDTGDHAVAPWLQYLTKAPTRAAVLSAASHRPTLLRIIEPAGAC